MIQPTKSPGWGYSFYFIKFSCSLLHVPQCFLLSHPPGHPCAHGINVEVCPNGLIENVCSSSDHECLPTVFCDWSNWLQSPTHCIARYSVPSVHCLLSQPSFLDISLDFSLGLREYICKMSMLTSKVFCYLKFSLRLSHWFWKPHPLCTCTQPLDHINL